MFLRGNGEHGILSRCVQGLEAVWNIFVDTLFSQLLRKQHYYVITIVIAGELRDCAVSFELLLLKS